MALRTTIIGTGIAVPRNLVPNERLARIMDTTDEWIRTRSGIEQRYFADPGQGSADLGRQAAERAVASAGVSKDDIDAVVFATAMVRSCRINSDSRHPSRRSTFVSSAPASSTDLISPIR